MREWIRAWERLVFGGRVTGYLFRESVEERYVMKMLDRRLSGADEVVEVLSRLGGTDVRAVAGLGSLSFIGGGYGEHGGYYGIEVQPEEGAIGDFPLSGVFQRPEETASWLAAIARTLLEVPFTVNPPSAPYAAPLEVRVRDVALARPTGAGTCRLEVRSGSQRLNVFVDLRDFTAGVRPLLIRQVVEERTVETSADLHDWLDPMVTALLGEGVTMRGSSATLPQAMTAKVTGVRGGRFKLDVGAVGTRWLRTARDVEPLLNPVMYRTCEPARPEELADWLTTVASAVFSESVTWSTNWPGFSSPFKASGAAAQVAEEIFGLGQPTRCRVMTVDTDLIKVMIPTPERDVQLAGWQGPREPALRLA
jgi:hypothetical protein